MDELIDEMRGTFLFEPFTEEQLYWLMAHATVETLQPGEYALRQTQPPDSLWVLLSGEWQLSRTLNGREVVMNTSSTPGGWAGWLPLSDDRLALDLRATRSSRLLRIPSAAVEHMFVSGYPIGRHILAGMYQGIQTIMAQTREQEKMIALGKLSAGLAHELNNPAAAARSAAGNLRRTLDEGEEALVRLVTAGRPDGEAVAFRATLRALMRDLDTRMAATEPLDPLNRADREDDIAAWLDGHGVSDGYLAAGALVDAGLDDAWLAELSERVPHDAVSAVIQTVISTVSARALTEQLKHSTDRICELVAAIKSYSYMDQAPIQDVDLHAGLDSTLTVLGHRLNGGITVIRDYDPALPRICAAGQELNHVWTNLIDNALDAMDGAGRLRLRTSRNGAEAVVEIGDTGHGIPPEVRPRIFEPFFTTKDVGQGTGLGLDIAYRIVVTQHQGTITVRSAPGDTVFIVRLPVDGPTRR